MGTTVAADCPPRFSTPRTPSRRTLGGRVAEIAEALGTPLMPWQRHVVDVAMEVDDDGRLYFREVRLTVPRQSGKTTLLLAVLVHRCLAWADPQNVVYAAQNGVAARSKFIDDHLRVLERSAFAPLLKSRLTNGHEAILWSNGSKHSISASTDKAGHGQVLDVAVMDESFAHVDARLEQAFRPAMNTRPSPQLWIVSTAGTPEQSPYLLAKVEDGRARANAGETGPVAYFEWSAADDVDVMDPATWPSFMPALGHTTPIEAIEAALASGMEPAEFARAYANRWVTRAADDLALPMDSWSLLADPGSQLLDPVAFGLDVPPDRSGAVIAAYGRRADGLGHVEVIDQRGGVSWVAERIADLVARWRPRAVILDPFGPAGSLIADLQARGVDPVLASSRAVGQACGAFYDDVVEGNVRHLDQPALNAAVGGAKRRPLGDAWAYGRKGSSADISPLVAATLARFAWHNAEPTDITQTVW